MTYRSGYGRSTYGSYNYGLDGAIIGAASIIAVTSATAAASVRVRGAASIIETVTTTASAADRVREGSATIAVAASVCLLYTSDAADE